MYSTLCSYNEVSERKEKVIKKIIWKSKYIHSHVQFLLLFFNLHRSRLAQFKPMLFKCSLLLISWIARSGGSSCCVIRTLKQSCGEKLRPPSFLGVNFTAQSGLRMTTTS